MSAPELNKNKGLGNMGSWLPGHKIDHKDYIPPCTNKTTCTVYVVCFFEGRLSNGFTMHFFFKMRSLWLYFIFFFVFGPTTWHVGSQFLDQWLNPCPLHWQCRVLTSGLKEIPIMHYSSDFISALEGRNYFVPILQIMENELDPYGSRSFSH